MINLWLAGLSGRRQQWWARRADPRRALAATLARRRAGTQDPGHLAQDAVRAVLGDPRARLVLALPDGRGWVAPDRPGPAARRARLAYPIAGPTGRPMAYVLTSGGVVDPDPVGTARVLHELHGLIEQAHEAAAVRDRQQRRAAAQAARERLERDLHDGVQGRLVALALNLQEARRTATDPAVQRVLDGSVADLRTALDELRGLTTSGSPTILRREGLPAALHDLAARLPVPVRVRAPVPRLNPRTERTVYFVVSEAVTNAVKHSGASRVTVSITVDGDTLAVRVSDDGRGGADPEAGSGLRGVRSRVIDAGGCFAVHDRRLRGTVVQVELPVGAGTDAATPGGQVEQGWSPAPGRAACPGGA